MKNISFLITLIAALLIFSFTPTLAADNPFLELVSGSKIYFSHIATIDGWETEIAAINPTTAPAAATLTSYDSTGSQIGQEVRINLASHGRYQVEVGKSFTNPGSIAYIVLTSETFGLKGYSKFYSGEMRASIMASTPKTSGLFTKIEKNGWTGIAFINTASVTANITLTAYSDQGEAVAVETMQVPSGDKIVKTVEQIFVQSVVRATYVGYTSDQGVVGFFLNGSSDYTMLDGSKAL